MMEMARMRLAVLFGIVSLAMVGGFALTGAAEVATSSVAWFTDVLQFFADHGDEIAAIAEAILEML